MQKQLCAETARRSISSPAVSSDPIAVCVCSRISPVSSPSPMNMVVTPVIFSPLITLHCTGPAPRYLGSKDAWTLIHPYAGSSKISLGKSAHKPPLRLHPVLASLKSPAPSRRASSPADTPEPHATAQFLYRRRHQFIAAAFWPVRLGKRSNNFMGTAEQCPQSGNGKIRRSHIHNTQIFSPYL